MATESPMRMVEVSGPRKWPSSTTAAATFTVPLNNMAAEELGLLLQRQRLDRDQKNTVPNRSGSAPPSMEGSFSAVGNLLGQQNSTLNPTLGQFRTENCESEEQLRADPAYFAYYCANVNLNPRLPPPLISRESQRIVRHIGGFGNNPKLTSFEDNDNGSTRSYLSTHKEEPEDDRSPSQASLEGRHTVLVDPIQEDLSCSPSHVKTEEPIDINLNALSLTDHSVNILRLSESNSGFVDASLDPLNIGLISSDPLATSFSRIQYPEETAKQPPPHLNEPSRTSYKLVNDVLNRPEMNSYARNMQLHHPRQQGGPTNAVYGVRAQLVTRGYPTFSSVEARPPPNAPGPTPPLYATAAYMTSGTPYNPNLHSSGFFTPQYTVVGHAPYVAEYPSHGAVPMSFDGTSFNVRTTGISDRPTFSHLGGLQHPNQFYGQPPFLDPRHLPPFQHSFDGAYGSLGQYGSPSHRKESNSYNNMGIMTHLQASPLSSPVMPRSPVLPTNYPIWRDEMRFLHPHDSTRHVELYDASQGQRGGGSSSHDLKRHSFLEELKSTNSRKFELSDITGRIVEFSVDQHGSRFIQQKLENCTVDEKESVFREVVPHASKLMIDVFGNYVIQKFFEHGNPAQRKELADQLAGHILPLSLQMYGCRVIQKALEVIDLDQKSQLMHELDGNVMRCVCDQNGNHVIQKCIECVPTNKIGFIISAFQGQVAKLSMHPYGCRVIQRILEHCSDEVDSQCIVDEILESACVLAQDQYGNYVTQHVLERGNPHERSQIISKLSGKIVQMSQHKYASNVVEKCLEYGDAAERELLIGEIIGQSEENDNLLTMMKDQFANFVVQKILETSSDTQQEILLTRIKVHLQALKKYTYGKHIVARFEQLAAGEEESRTAEQLGV